MRRLLPNQFLNMEASLWLKLQVLLDSSELIKLLHEIKTLVGFPHLYRVGSLVPIGQGEISLDEFSNIYTQYIQGLKSNEPVPESLIRSAFSSVLTLTDEALVALDLGKGEELLRVEKPVIQLQWLKIYFSEESAQFYPMAKGMDMISWGLQFSYPQLFRDSEKNEDYKVDDSPRFPNTALFRFIQRWLRNATIPTPFVIKGQESRVCNVPMRLGKACLPWISHHPDLQRKGLQVKGAA